MIVILVHSRFRQSHLRARSNRTACAVKWGKLQAIQAFILATVREAADDNAQRRGDVDGDVIVTDVVEFSRCRLILPGARSSGSIPPSRRALRGDRPAAGRIREP